MQPQQQQTAEVSVARRRTSWRYGPIDGVTSGDNTLLLHTEERAALHLRRGKLSPGRGYRSASPNVRRELRRLGAIFQLRERGLFHVHAAGVVAPDGRAWLLAGESGSGKSTLTYALARAGWKVLGDDGVAIERREGEVLAHPSREPIDVSIELSGAFPELRDAAGKVDWSDPRHRAPMIAPAGYASPAPVRALAIVAQSPRDELTTASPTQVLAALVRQSPTVLLNDAHAARQLTVLAALVNAVPVFHLQHSPLQLHRIATTLTEAACTLDIGPPPTPSSPPSAMAP
jgi:energy-coupling factor transporter ATP-binding protein EcfA2